MQVWLEQLHCADPECPDSLWCRYDQGDFDTVMVNLTYNLCLKCIDEMQQASLQEICSYVNSTVRLFALACITVAAMIC